MYDYLAKVILLGPSGAGKSVCTMRWRAASIDRLIPFVQILPTPSLHQERMAGCIVADNRR
jgi:hypothetical protein